EDKRGAQQKIAQRNYAQVYRKTVGDRSLQCDQESERGRRKHCRALRLSRTGTSDYRQLPRSTRFFWNVVQVRAVADACDRRTSETEWRTHGNVSRQREGFARADAVFDRTRVR